MSMPTNEELRIIQSTVKNITALIEMVESGFPEDKREPFTHSVVTSLAVHLFSRVKDFKSLAKNFARHDEIMKNLFEMKASMMFNVNGPEEMLEIMLKAAEEQLDKLLGEDDSKPDVPPYHRG